MNNSTRSTVFWYSDVQSAASELIQEAKQYSESEWENFINDVAFTVKVELLRFRIEPFQVGDRVQVVGDYPTKGKVAYVEEVGDKIKVSFDDEWQGYYKPEDLIKIPVSQWERIKEQTKTKL
jgi:hypothetical protein